MIRPTFNRIKSATTDESRLKFSSTGLPITSLTYLHKQTLCMYFINKLFVNVYNAPLLPQHHTSTYSASLVLIFRASRSAVASFSQLDADHKVTTWAHLPKSAQAAWEYGNNGRGTYTVPIWSAAKSGLLARPRLPAGDRAGCWVPRQLSDPLARLPQLTAHSWLAGPAHCCLSLGI